MSMMIEAGFLRVFSPEQGNVAEDCEMGMRPELRLWSGDADLGLLSVGEEVVESDDAAPMMILKWRGAGVYSRPMSMQQLLARTRAIHRNRQCRECQGPCVEPVHQDDAALNRNRMPIPGTATLIGFRCQHCAAEWRV